MQQTSTSNAVSNGVGTAVHQDDKLKERSHNASTNYVKRVMSGFLVVSNPKDRECDDKYEHQHKNHSDEPEWFSCGPTSRLDTIELCGFDEDDEQLLHSERNSSKSSGDPGDINDDEVKENRISHANKVVSHIECR